MCTDIPGLILLFSLILLLFNQIGRAQKISICYADCYLVLYYAQQAGLTPALCESNSDFNTALTTCSSCLKEADPSGAAFDLVQGEVSGYIQYCEIDIPGLEWTGIVGGPSSTTTSRSHRTATASEPTGTVGESSVLGSTSNPTTAKSTSSFPRPSSSRPTPTILSESCSNPLCEYNIRNNWNTLAGVGDTIRDYSGCLEYEESGDLSTFKSCSDEYCAAASKIPEYITTLFARCIDIVDKERKNVGHSRGLSSGQIAGICVGSVAAVALGCGGLFWVLRARRMPVPPPGDVGAYELTGDRPKLKESETPTAIAPVEIGSSELKPPLLDGREIPAELPAASNSTAKYGSLSRKPTHGSTS